MDEFGDDMDSIFDPEPKPRRGSRALGALRRAGSAVSNRLPKNAIDIMYGPKKGRISPMRRFGMLNDVYQLGMAGSAIAHGDPAGAVEPLAYMGGWHTLNALSQKFAGPAARAAIASGAAKAGGKFVLGRLAGFGAGIPGAIITIGAPIAYDMYQESTGRPAVERLAASRMALFDKPQMELLEDQPGQVEVPEEYEEYEEYDPEELEDYEFV